jgi:hypothetical protein
VNDVCLWSFHVRTCECIRLWPYFQSVRVSILSHRNLDSVWLTSWILLRWTNTLITNRERGAIFDLVGSFSIHIRGDSTCVPLSLKGLSEATTCIPHRIFSMWMTCVMQCLCMAMQWNRQNRLESGTGEHVISPELFANGLVYMWLIWRHSSIKSEQLWLLDDLLCWNLKSIDVYGTTPNIMSVHDRLLPFLVINLITKGSCFLYSLSSSWVHECMRMMTWGKPPTKCLCHCDLWLPRSYRCPMIGEAEA